MKPCQNSQGKWAAGSAVQLVDICSAQLVRRNSRVSQSFKDTLSLKDFLSLKVLSWRKQKIGFRQTASLNKLFPFLFIFFKILFIYLRARQRDWVGGGVEGEREAPCWARSLLQGSNPGLQDHDLNHRQTLNQLSHPGIPEQKLLYDQRNSICR